MREPISLPDTLVHLTHAVLDEAERTQDASGTITAEVEALLDALQQHDNMPELATELLLRIYQSTSRQGGAQGLARGLITKAGANPLAHRDDFDKLAQGVVYTTSVCLVEMEHAGRGLRTGRGGNYLHALAWDNSALLREFSSISAQENKLCHPDWMMQADGEGNSVLHALWDGASVRPSVSAERLWTATAWLINNGLTPEQANQAGDRPLDLMAQACAKRPILLLDSASHGPAIRVLQGRVRAQIDARALDASTDQPQASRPSLRL